MGGLQPTADRRSAGATQQPGWAAAIGLSPLLWGGLLTVGFYGLIPYLPIHRELAVRYFCSHPLEYITTTLFFVGIAILAFKAGTLIREKAAFESDLIDDDKSAMTADPSQRAAVVEEKLPTLAARLRTTALVNRIRNACSYVRDRKSSQGLEEHLKYLADLAAERLHESYALVRTITWAVPILGFLGTVIGITIAVAKLTPEQLDTSLAEVTGGLAIAFDTTALALALSIVMVFTSFLIEQSEQRILARVEEFGIKRISPLFPAALEPTGPLAQAEEQAAHNLIERTEALIDRQTRLWYDTLESLRARWTETLTVQKEDFDAALKQGMSATLADHDQQLSAIRNEFLQAFQTVSEQLTSSFEETRRAQHDQQHEFGRLLAESTDAGTAQLTELRKLGEILRSVLEQEGQLGRLQGRLTENLESLRATETFEETLHSLSAAVHLLTARVKPKAA